mmetsp:Transcript_64756/g.162963  ORF Transcript_64756/g.162963 Transcript_64756/m.162963 type:complete len:231 (+) Transcript_64756:274-966(+)
MRPLEGVGRRDPDGDGAAERDGLSRLLGLAPVVSDLCLGRDARARRRQALPDRTLGARASARVHGRGDLLREARKPPMHGVRAVDGADDEASCEALPDLDHACEEKRIVEALHDCGHGHDLGDGAEAVDGWSLQPLQILQAIWHELQCISNKLIETSEGLLANPLGDDLARCTLHWQANTCAMGCRPTEFPKITGGGMLLPDGLRPEGATIHVILQVIPDDVRLLEEQTH